MKSARRPLARWRRDDRRYDGYVRPTEDGGYEVVDWDTNIIAGPNPDRDLVVRMAHDVGVEVE